LEFNPTMPMSLGDHFEDHRDGINLAFLLNTHLAGRRRMCYALRRVRRDIFKLTGARSVLVGHSDCVGRIVANAFYQPKKLHRGATPIWAVEALTANPLGTARSKGRSEPALTSELPRVPTLP
jgi:hypothetical protein